MRASIARHTLKHNILGKIIFATDMRCRFVFVNPSLDLTIGFVRTLTVMKTGCLVLDSSTGPITVIPPGYRYYTYQPEV